METCKVKSSGNRAFLFSTLLSTFDKTNTTMGAIDELRWHAEIATYRAVTGVSANFPNGDGVPTIATFPAKGTIPIAKVLTGTISSTNENVRGTGTKFTTELFVDDYLYDADAAVRRIVKIIDDELLVLESAFPVDVVGITVRRCTPQTFKKIQVWSSHASNAAEFQEAPLGAGQWFVTGGAPFAYDALTGQISFVCSK
jgi:hypothetical protein